MLDWMLGIVELEVARASNTLWASGAFLQNPRTARLPNSHRMRHTDFRNNMNPVIL